MSTQEDPKERGCPPFARDPEIKNVGPQKSWAITLPPPTLFPLVRREKENTAAEFFFLVSHNFLPPFLQKKGGTKFKFTALPSLSGFMGVCAEFCFIPPPSVSKPGKQICGRGGVRLLVGVIPLLILLLPRKEKKEEDTHTHTLFLPFSSWQVFLKFTGQIDSTTFGLMLVFLVQGSSFFFCPFRNFGTRKVFFFKKHVLV